MHCPPERWKSSTKRRFSCFPWASSALSTFRSCPGHVEASSRASEARGTERILVHKSQSVRHDQREPSTVLAHDEDKTEAGVRRPAWQEARLYHQLRQRSAIGPPPRPAINMPRLDSAVLQSRFPPKDCTARERATLCTPDLRWEPQQHLARFPLMHRARSGAMLSRGASLRRAFVAFFEKTNTSREQGLSSAATRLQSRRRYRISGSRAA